MLPTKGHVRKAGKSECAPHPLRIRAARNFLVLVVDLLFVIQAEKLESTRTPDRYRESLLGLAVIWAEQLNCSDE